MKYLKIILAIVLSAAFLFIYLYIPNNIIVSNNVYVPQAGSSVTRSFVQIQYWDKWMPRKSIQGHSFIFEDGELEMIESFIATAKGVYTKPGLESSIIFSAIDAGKDSSMIRFEATIDNRHLSPFTRIHQFIESKKLNALLNNIILSAAAYYSTNKGIYGFDIVETKVKDSTLITYQKSFSDTPTIVQQYDIIGKLLDYIKKNNGVVHSDPMVNITRISASEVYTQIGFALEKDIPSNNQFIIKKMVLGNILETKVVGGQRQVNAAFEASKLYISDHLKASPAIPYVTYQTNRLEEKDQQKWKSTVYFPIF
jgi:hypothetical protein